MMANSIAIAQAIYSINPSAIFIIDNGIIKWLNGTAPIPQNQIDAAVANQTNTLSVTTIKQRAIQALKDTDWTQLPDVSLKNKNDFTNYRASMRSIALNPSINAVFPILPVEQW